MITRLRFSIVFVAIYLLIPFKTAASFDHVLTHAPAASQPTALGKTICSLKQYNGSIYTGYGDYGANTGPIEICEFTPPGNTLTCEYTLSTEQIGIYRTLNGKLYAIATDPSNPSQHAYAVKNGSSAWSGVSRNIMLQGSIPPAHIFDMNYYNGHLWAVGSQHSSNEMNVPPYADDGDATVWTSTNGGTTWSVSLDVHQIDNCCARIYFSGIHDNKLYVQAVDYDEYHPFSKVFDGSTWSTGPNLLIYGNARKAFSFNSLMLMMQGNNLVAFDGQDVDHIYSDVVDYTIYSGAVYILTSDKKVYKSSSLVSWRYIDQLNITASANSIEVYDEVVYVGTGDSKIYSTELYDTPNIVPMIYFLLLEEDE